MASTSDKGHAKNVANLKSLISYCKGYKEKYHPYNENFTILNLELLLSVAETALEDVKKTGAAFTNATNTRVLAFRGLKPLGTKILNSFSSSGANKLAQDDIRGIIRKIKGTRAPGNKKTPPPPTDPATEQDPDNSISVSQQSYDNMIDHFKKLVKALLVETIYNPNEEELKTSGIQTRLDLLETTNSTLIDSNTDYRNALIKRNDILYNKETGLVFIANEVKKYVRSIYGAGTPEAKQLTSLEFIYVPA